MTGDGITDVKIGESSREIVPVKYLFGINDTETANMIRSVLEVCSKYESNKAELKELQKDYDRLYKLLGINHGSLGAKYNVIKGKEFDVLLDEKSEIVTSTPAYSIDTDSVKPKLG